MNMYYVIPIDSLQLSVEIQITKENLSHRENDWSLYLCILAQDYL